MSYADVMSPAEMQAEIIRLQAELDAAKATVEETVTVKLNADNDMVVVRVPGRRYPFSFYRRDFSFFTPEVLKEAKTLAETITAEKITPEQRAALRAARGGEGKFRY